MEGLVSPPSQKQSPQSSRKSAHQSKDLWTVVREGSVSNVDSALSMLKKNGGNIDARNLFGLTPLHIATWRNHIPVVRRLLEAGADPNARVQFFSCLWSFWSSIVTALRSMLFSPSYDPFDLLMCTTLDQCLLSCCMMTGLESFLDLGHCMRSLLSAFGHYIDFRFLFGFIIIWARRTKEYGKGSKWEFPIFLYRLEDEKWNLKWINDTEHSPNIFESGAFIFSLWRKLNWPNRCMQ